jgi:putative secretion ATPase (PEP-CTERM system associated)
MHTSFYNLSGLPFQLSPDPRFFFGSRSHRKAMAYLTYGLSQSEGFIVITGDIGMGKTTLVGQLFSKLDKEKFIAANVVTTQLAAGGIVRMVAAAFAISHDRADKATLLKRIESFLVRTANEGRRALLVIDEAQNLPAASLEELRMLSNFQLSERALMQCFLLGQPQFRHTLASEGLEQLRQRVIASYHLEPMESEETHAYIEHRLQTVGWHNDPSFTEAAFRMIHEQTGGVPRRINTICSRLLLFGFLEELHEIDAPVVEEVINDLVREGLQAKKSRGSESDHRMSTGVSAAAALDLETISRRLTIVEEYVRLHERIVRRALQIAERYVERGHREPEESD